MQTAPLQPVRFWVESADLKVNPAFQPQQGPVHPVPLVTVEIEVAQGTDGTGTDLYHCRLGIETRVDAPENQPPYAVHLRVMGIFTFLNEIQLDEAAKQQHVATSGVALTYGFARDTLLHMTVFGVYGPLMLPAVYFTEEARDLQAKIRQEIAPAAPEEGVSAPPDPSPEPVSRRAPKRRPPTRSSSN